MRFAVALSAALGAYNNVLNAVAPGTPFYVPVNLAATAALLVAARRAGMGSREAGMRRGGLRLAAAGALVVAAGLAVALAAPRTREFLRDERIADLTQAGLAYETLVRIPLGTVLLEEAAFRGVLFAAWTRALSVPQAAIASSAVFGVWHVVPTYQAAVANGIAPAPAVAAGTLGTFLGGLFLCGFRVAGRGIWAPALVHWSANALATAAGFAAWRT